MHLLDYLLNVLILGQCLFFMYLYEKSIGLTTRRIDTDIGYFDVDELIELYFYIISFLFMLIIVATGFTFQFYKTNLIIQYCVLVLYAFRVLKTEERVLTAISLSFLLVFFNSYLWESVLHFAEYTQNPVMLFNFRELIHLVVLPFLYAHYTVDKKPVLYKLKMLFFINFLFSVLTIEVYPRFNSYQFDVPFFVSVVGLTHFVNRFISLVLLLDVFVKYTKARTERKWWFWR